MDPLSYKKMVQTYEDHAKSYKMAVEAGVKIALGTDIGISGNDKSGLSHGLNGAEFQNAVDAGMTPLQAIEAGTASASATLGPRAPKSGQLKAGYDSDFIAVASSPLDDMKILSVPEKITHIWKAGKLVKSPGNPVG